MRKNMTKQNSNNIEAADLQSTEDSDPKLNEVKAIEAASDIPTIAIVTDIEKPMNEDLELEAPQSPLASVRLEIARSKVST